MALPTPTTPDADDTDREPAAGRKERTQARILEASIELFAARGYAGTSISAIAAQARVSRGAVFWHFGDKETLFRESFRRLLVPFVQKVKATFEHVDANKRLFELFDVYEKFVAEHRDTIQSIMRWVLESQSVRATIEKPLMDLHGEFARDVRRVLEELVDDPREAAALAAGMVSMLHGNLLFSMIDPDATAVELRRVGLRRVARRALGIGEGD